MNQKRIVAYWNIYDSETGNLIVTNKAIMQNAMPAYGGLVIGLPEKFKAIIKHFRFSGTINGLPRYDVYI